ncbi:hypothetical protein Poli38472_010575 [Pythium oligandrum]|uniref:Uncharacterized protein n=1 Tax=Pythium oligandrum TaxID=41045 RepID=A0A8K1FEB0_PYTOL|nr:hypothetical protein Poli38472_010575 [Pythium oligandrum]|eukprot:TMW55693.1 hypothetical protein Poli38472_010575 [Pythium oligandrum]
MPCGTTQVYHVHNLDSHKVYDVKISYPASIPTIFTIDAQQLLVNGENEPKSTRRRLNTAKLRLLPSELLRKWHATASKETQARYRLETLDSQSFVVEIAVRADVEGVSPTLDLSKRQCVYNIVVEEMLFAAFPHDTLILIAWLLFLLFVTARFVYPYVYRKISLELDEDKKITNELRTKKS